MRLRYLLATAFICALAAATDANAVPSFARQLNVACNACHTRFPELTPLGRQFKLAGYTLSGSESIQGQNSKTATTLSIPELPPLSLMLQGAYTSTKASQPDVQNGNAQLPQQLSLFLAGKIAPKIGSFVQVTYSQADDKFGMDNMDLRYSSSKTLRRGKSVTWGITINNNPTVEDLWNSTPAWGFPYAGPDVAPTPAAGTLIDGQLAQDVAGIGAYAFFNSKFYVAATLYRSAHLGTGAPLLGSENTIDSLAPYWRVAWQHNFGKKYLEVGGYGIEASLIPQGIVGTTNDYRDVAADTQLDMPAGKGELTVHGTLIHERQKWNAAYALGDSANVTDNLDTFRADANYAVNAWKYTLGLFSTTGSSDSGLYAPDPIDGSATGSPDSRGWIGQVSYFPALNVQLTLQYTVYNRFNGRASNYDSFGRSASDNNTLFLQGWWVW